MKKLLLFILFPFFLFGQTQIGDDIYGITSHSFVGSAVSLSSNGGIIAIGGTGASKNNLFNGYVQVYKNEFGKWVQIGNDINGKSHNDNFGTSVSLSSDGSIVAIGSKFNDENGESSGHIQIFRFKSGNWNKIGYDIKGESKDDKFGGSVSLSSDGKIVASGSKFNSGNGDFSGHVRVYKRNKSDIWLQEGSDIEGETAENLGGSVSLSSDGSVVATGATGSNVSTGYVRIYKNISNKWTQVGNDIKGKKEKEQFGTSVCLSSDGNIVAIAAPYNNENGIDSGSVRIFKNESGNWSQIGSDINGDSEYNYSGFSLSLSSNGSVVAIGTRHANAVKGHIRIFQNINNNWIKLDTEINGNLNTDNIGFSLSLSSNGSIIAVGAPLNQDNNNFNSGYVKVYDLSEVLSSDSFVLSKFSIFPNPAKNLVTVTLKDNLIVEKISIYNNLGQIIKTSKELTIDTSNLLKGIYYLQIETDKGKALKKLIKK